jgi:Ner family transcriptional regulator
MEEDGSKDWHQAMIVAHLRIAGTSLRQLSKDHALSPTALSVALQRPWAKAERIIADVIGVAPEKIWPSRYAKRETKRLRINRLPNSKRIDSNLSDNNA